MKVLKINKSSFVDSGNRFDASYHLSDGPITKIKLKKSPYQLTTLSEESEKIFSGNIFKRTFVSNKDKGYDYLTGSDMVKSDIESGKYISKKHTKKTDDLRIHKDWILITCSGTIGNTVYTNNVFEGRIGTHDLIRIIPNDKNVKRGFIYAYLSSKYGYGLLTQSSYGGVVKHIEPHHIQNLPIPILPESQQEEIHQLIVYASDLRVEANFLLDKAVRLFESKLPLIEDRKIYSVSIKDRIKYNSRLESTFDTKQIDEFYNQLKMNDIEVISIEKLSTKVFTPNIFKRIRTDNPDKGVPYLSGSDLLDQYPKFDDFLSKKMTNINSYILRKDWLAIQDAGTIGYVSYIHEFLDGVSATNNLIRIVPNEKNWNPYIFTFFKTKLGQRFLKFYEFGSVQKHIDNHQISSFMIPIFDEIKNLIKDHTLRAMNNYALACKKENQAIDLIEKEIDSWQ